MPRFLTALIFFALLCAPVQAQDVKLVTTATKKVVVEKVVTLEPGQVLSAADFPVRMTAPTGGFGYVWDYPGGFTVKRKGNTLEILAAPKGKHVVGVTFSVVDFDAKKVSEQYGEDTLMIGDGPDPPKPDPDPPDPIPLTDFEKKLQTAWVADGKNEQQRADLAALYQQAVTVADEANLKTAKDLFDRLKNAIKILMPDTTMLQTRMAISLELQKFLPAGESAPLTVETRQAAKTAFQQVATALGRIK